MQDRWHTAPHPDHRSSEPSGDFRGRRTNGRLSPLAKVCLAGAVALLIAFITGVSAWAWTRVSGDSSTALANSNTNSARVDLVENNAKHLKEDVDELKDGQKAIQKSIVEGQQAILDTLYTLPSKRRSSTKPVLSLPESEDPD